MNLRAQVIRIRPWPMLKEMPYRFNGQKLNLERAGGIRRLEKIERWMGIRPEGEVLKRIVRETMERG